MSNYLIKDSDLNTYATFTDADLLSVLDAGTSSFSCSIWIRIADKNISTVLFEKYDGITGYQARLNAEQNGDLSLDLLMDDNTDLVTTRIDNVPVKIGEWQLFTFVVDRSSYTKIYVDAVLHADTGQTADEPPQLTLDNTDDFHIGFDSTNPSSSSLGVIDIDGFYFHKHTIGPVLSQSEIRSLYNRGRGVKIDGTEREITFGLNFDEGTGATLTDAVGDSITGTIVSNSSPFDNVWSEAGGVDVMTPSDIELYLTSLEPDLEQKNYSQSLGGHISESLLYPQTTLTSAVGLYQTDIAVSDAADLLGFNYISMVNEIIEVEEISSVNITATERGVNQTVGYYPTGTIVQGVVSPFNDSFNRDRKQYRCYAIKNTSTTEEAYEVRAYFRQLSKNNNTIMRLALETPKTQGIIGISTSWTSSMLIDNSLVGIYEDNLFSDAYMTFVDSPNAGEKRRISSFDGETGTFVFADSLPIDYDESIHSSLINYTIDASPAQRVKSGTDAPADTDNITSFSEAQDRDNSVRLDSIKSEGRLSSGEIIYIWIERGIGKSSVSYEENSFVLSLDFNKEFIGN